MVENIDSGDYTYDAKYAYDIELDIVQAILYFARYYDFNIGMVVASLSKKDLSLGGIKDDLKSSDPPVRNAIKKLLNDELIGYKEVQVAKTKQKVYYLKKNNISKLINQ